MHIPAFKSIVGALLMPVIIAPSPVRCYLNPGQKNQAIGKAVLTSSGVIRGHTAPTDNDVSEYLGIPYAHPPVDELRWMPPVKYTGVQVINATNFGEACIQASPLLAAAFDGNYSSVLPQLEAEYDSGIFIFDLPDTRLPQSEDCLTLNVWTKPQVGEAKKAVLIWTHGGSFTTGSSVAEAWYNGQYLAEEQDVVVVSINYRLNIFGFPGNPTTAPNLGILDQRMAVEWVRDNIAVFGGDPDRIILFGQSAGAASADIHSFAYVDDPIVSGYILQSGTVSSFGLQAPEVAANLWFKASQSAGCGGSNVNPDKVFDCMRNLSSTRLANNIPPVDLGDQGLPFGPVIDNKIIFPDYFNRKPADRPMIIGNTDDESALFKWQTNKPVPPDYWHILNFQAFTCPVAARAEASRLRKYPVWRYRWFGVFPNLLLNWFPGPPQGAWHGSELPSVFNTTPLSPLPDTKGQIAIGKYLRGAWAAFAKDPINGLGNYDNWPLYNPKEETLIRLAHNDTTGTNLADGDKYDKPCSGPYGHPGGHHPGGPGGPGGAATNGTASVLPAAAEPISPSEVPALMATTATSTTALLPRNANGTSSRAMPSGWWVLVVWIVAYLF